MPNHITNSITLSGNKEKIAEMMENIKNDEVGVGSIDFNKIIPMPESLNIESGSATERGYKAYKDFMEVYTLFGTTNMDNILHVPLSSEEVFLRQRSDIDRAEFELGKTAFQNMVKYGATTWYDWCIQNWGTKWNSYGYDPEVDYNDGDSLWFQTAWSAPHPILEKLSEMYPSITFAHQWADEDLGANCGSRTYLGGEMIDEFIPEGVRAMQFALELWDYDPVDLGLALNKTGTGYVSMTEDKYELIELFGIKTLNDIAKRMAEMSPEDQVKFKAALVAERPYGLTLADMDNIAANLDKYEMTTVSDNAGAFFKEYLLHHLDTRFDPEWLDTLVSFREGNKLLERLGACVTDYGIISVSGGSLFQLMPYNQEQTGQEEAPAEAPNEDEGIVMQM